MGKAADMAAADGSRNGPTLVEVLRRRAAETPGSAAYTFLRDGEDDEETVTYGELDVRARAIAGAIARTAPEAAAALVVLDPGLEFVAAFLGCLYAGVIAVPAAAPGGRDLAAATHRLHALAADAGASVVVTSQALAARPSRVAAIASSPLVVVDEVGGDAASAWRPRRRADDVAFLQYTSGSTGTPRGVAVTHANLVAHGARVASVLRLDADAVAVSWLPIYHDMGLIGTLLIPLQIGFRSVQMPPLAFLERPVRWLRAITRYRGTLSPAPNFAYDLVARRTTPADRRTLALDSWRAAMNGAEPIRAATCARFVATFAACGFRPDAFVPCYGLAEATLMVAGGPLGAGPVRRLVDGAALDAGAVVARTCATDAGVRELVASGAPLPGLTVRIVDRVSAAAVEPGRVGEICVAGPTVAAGYWRRSDESASTFAAPVDGTGKFLRTGDLGFLDDGLLFVTGRCKDLIIVRGRNHHPHDLEDTAGAAHPALRPGGGAAFAVEDGRTERVVVVHEADAVDETMLATAAAAVRAAVQRAHAISLAAVVLIAPRALPKTTSGKVRRSTCRELLLAGRLPVRHGDLDALRRPAPAADAGNAAASAIEACLLRIVAELRDLPAEAVSRDAALAALGIDSAEVAELAVALEAQLGRRVPLAVLMEQPTIAAVATALSEMPA